MNPTAVIILTSHYEANKIEYLNLLKHHLGFSATSTVEMCPVILSEFQWLLKSFPPECYIFAYILKDYFSLQISRIVIVHELTST